VGWGRLQSCNSSTFASPTNVLGSNAHLCRLSVITESTHASGWVPGLSQPRLSAKQSKLGTDDHDVSVCEAIRLHADAVSGSALALLRVQARHQGKMRIFPVCRGSIPGGNSDFSPHHYCVRVPYSPLRESGGRSVKLATHHHLVLEV
jgi:hypothetical protein